MLSGWYQRCKCQAVICLQFMPRAEKGWGRWDEMCIEPAGNHHQQSCHYVWLLLIALVILQCRLLSLSLSLILTQFPHPTSTVPYPPLPAPSSPRVTLSWWRWCLSSLQVTAAMPITWRSRWASHTQSWRPSVACSCRAVARTACHEPGMQKKVRSFPRPHTHAQNNLILEQFLLKC